ncbi:uncharacterized protein N0V89_008167 [Didymosphaeria variabile]|uniref:F-box domain-containing protein n=1 Tax=Didymosphaeria variabile TaxID=1932322 RepID=A0A9W9C895_9PLEO|nr:uncharacterized protein N0V89_008167 [Didymosphaeria variabile]KAJ4349551.1 hypothetical protein N0V89_008167 [Didymosphaeria variabile]
MPSFFTFPREIRNEIYHHLFIYDPYLSCDFYEGLHLVTRYSTHCCALQPVYDTYGVISKSEPTWLLTSKTFMREALEQYSLHASWIHNDPSSYGHACLYKLPLDKSRIRRLEINLGLWPQWSLPQTSYSEDLRPDLRQNLRVIAEASRAAGISFESVRFQGYTEGEMEDLSAASKAQGQVARIFEGLRAMFDGVEVDEWFLEVATPKFWKTEVVFALVGEEVVMVVDERWASDDTEIEREHTDRCTVFV